MTKILNSWEKYTDGVPPVNSGFSLFTVVVKCRCIVFTDRIDTWHIKGFDKLPDRCEYLIFVAVLGLRIHVLIRREAVLVAPVTKIGGHNKEYILLIEIGCQDFAKHKFLI